MKLFKLSLAAVVAAGALSSVSAAPLEEAIKDIDVSGFGRYRFQSTDTRPAIGDKSRNTFHRFTLDVNFKATLDDNFFSVIGLRYDTRDIVGSHNKAYSGIANTHGGLSGVNGGWGGGHGDSFSVRQYYVGYTAIPYTTVLFGRQPAGTFFTDDIVATGLKVAVNPVEGLTLAALYYTNFENDGDLANIQFDPRVTGNPAWRYNSNTGAWDTRFGESAYIHQKNLWGVAAIYQNEMLDLQAWYAGLNKVADLFAISAGADYAISDDVSVRGTAQWAHTNLAGEFKDNHGRTAWSDGAVANSNFYGFDLGASFYGFDLDAGYLTYGKEDKTSVHTLEDAGSLIKPGEELINYTEINGKHKIWFGTAAYTFDAYSIGVDYVNDKVKNTGGDLKADEWVVRAGYKYNDKLSFKAWYSMVTEKDGDIKDKSDRFRFDARYKF
ncbi:MAG: major outer membrane protein [Campylobacter sp.]|uniref:major outer membrane protein n=1 Tax=Campylobacter sp. TaxID=205 RepID=UPI002A7F866A|nr:major outer membrane protein [Campylobacter sp.]MDY5115804.1 major outer membrane protein [Campylobacter sp.]